MPTVLRSGPYRVFFYSSDRPEPAHVHVERDDCRAKVWLDPVTVASSGGFKPVELSEIMALISDHLEDLRSEWDEFFSK